MSATTGEPRKEHVPHTVHNPPPPLSDFLYRLLGIGSYHRELVEQADIHPGQRVLEIGCGTGNLAILSKRLHPDAEVVGLDPDPKALAHAERKAERARLSVRLDHGFAQELPYPDASFDRVLSAFMFHHLGPEEKENMLREARRVLKPGGSLHLLDFEREKAHSDGLMARVSHRNHRHGRPHVHFGGHVPTLMREAGLADSKEVAHRVTKVLGRVTYYRATMPRADSGAAQHGVVPSQEARR